MELYEKHVILFGLKNLVPIAVVMDAYNRTRKPIIVVHRLIISFLVSIIMFKCVFSFQYDEDSCHMDKLRSSRVSYCADI